MTAYDQALDEASRAIEAREFDHEAPCTDCGRYRRVDEDDRCRPCLVDAAHDYARYCEETDEATRLANCY